MSQVKGIPNWNYNNSFIIVRGHHWPCMHLYEGKGYNPEHTAHIDLIHKLLKKYPDTRLLQVIGQTDSFCLNCPGKAGANPKIQCNKQLTETLDKRVVDFLGLKAGKFYIYSEVAKIFKDIITFKNFEELCKGCNGWDKFCKNILMKKLKM